MACELHSATDVSASREAKANHCDHCLAKTLRASGHCSEQRGEDCQQHANREVQLRSNVASLAQVGEYTCLVTVFGKAPPPEVGPRHPVRGNKVADLCARLVEYGGWPMLVCDPVGQVQIVVTVGMKAADGEHLVSAHTHARADQVAHGSELVRQRAVVAAKHPVEFWWKPGRPTGPVIGQRRTADRNG
jgi:hypothetical protein